MRIYIYMKIIKLLVYPTFLAQRSHGKNNNKMIINAIPQI